LGCKARQFYLFKLCETYEPRSIPFYAYRLTNRSAEGAMRQRRVFDQLTLNQLNEPVLQLRAKERSALVQLVQSLLLEIVLKETTDTSDEESDNE